MWCDRDVLCGVKGRVTWCTVPCNNNMWEIVVLKILEYVITLWFVLALSAFCTGMQSEP